jgi:aminopeptidase N
LQAYGELLLLNRWLSGLGMHAKYQKFVRDLVEPLFDHVGFEIAENEHKFSRYSRRIAINLACQFGHESCLSTTKSKLSDADIHPDMQEAIYSNGLRGADEATYDEVIEKMLNLKNQAQRTLIIRALACAQNEVNLKKLLTLAIDEDEPRVRLQEKYRIFSAWPNAGIVGVKVIIEFVKENYEDINKISPSLVRSILNNAASYVSSDNLATQYTELLDFLKTKNVINDSHKDDYLSAVNATKLWQDKNVRVIEDWLDRNGAARRSFVVSTAFALLLSATIKMFF